MLDLRAELKLDEQVHFLGFNDDPAEFLSNLDMFVLSSSSEGFSIATIQAMAAGLPVIATRSGGPQEIITHEKDGCLVDVNAPQQIAKTVENLTKQAELRQKMARSGQRHTVETFDIKNMIKSYEAIYQKFL
jgi:glycosyltransferase involved in cell wall biosynthesis